MESKVLVLFLHHPDDNEQQVKDELSHGESSEDSEKKMTFSATQMRILLGMIVTMI